MSALTPGDREVGCDCGHRVTWHHDTRGCGYHGYSADHRCHCTLSPDEAVERIVAEHVAAAKAEALREAASDPALRLSGHSGVSVRALRDRADRIEGQ